MPTAENTVVIENARIVFRNFAGKEDMYNRQGDRNFCVLLDPVVAQQMSEDGWNIKTLKSKEEGVDDQPYIQVSVAFKGKPPRMVMISSQGRTEIDESACEMFDWVDIKVADLVIRPYEWVVNGKSGVKAYLKSLFLTIDEDELDRKYADVPVNHGPA